MSLTRLATAAGINKGVISLMEHGRMIPTSDEYDRIMAALNGFEADIPTVIGSEDVA